MRATVQSADLAHALKSGVANGKTPLDILQHALLSTDAEAGELHIQTTDCEVYVRATIPANVEEVGDALLHEGLLRAIAAGAGEIRLQGDGAVSRGRSRFHVGSLPAEGFPSPDVLDFTALDVDATALARAISAVAYAADDQDIRIYLRPVHVVPGAVWGTDSKQVGCKALAYDGPAMQIPAGQIQRVLAALAMEDAAVFAGNVRGGRAGMLRIRAPRFMVTVNLMDAPPPDVLGMVRGVRTGENCVVIERKPFADALRRFMPFAAVTSGTGTKTRAFTQLRLQATGGELSIASQAGDNTEVLDEQQVAQPPSGDFSFGVDPRLLLKAINAASGERLELYPPANEAANTPIVLVPEGLGTDDEVHLLARLVL